MELLAALEGLLGGGARLALPADFFATIGAEAAARLTAELAAWTPTDKCKRLNVHRPFQPCL